MAEKKKVKNSTKLKMVRIMLEPQTFSLLEKRAAQEKRKISPMGRILLENSLSPNIR